MPEIILRAALPRDARAIAGVGVRSWRSGYRGIVPDELLDALSVRERERSWRGWLSDGDTETIVAVAAGAIVGFCTTGWPDGPAIGKPCEIAALYVDPPLMRRGVGAALLTAALDAAVADGRSEVTLWVLEANAAARAFYEHFEFAPDGVRDYHLRTRQPMIRMSRTLAG